MKNRSILGSSIDTLDPIFNFVKFDQARGYFRRRYDAIEACVSWSINFNFKMEKKYRIRKFGLHIGGEERRWRELIKRRRKGEKGKLNM